MARLAGVGAITLDGKATRDEIFVDLKERVAALTAAGRTPGLGTVLVGDDPGSQAYVRGKHADCAKVGITSMRRDLPADISQAKLNETIDELNANPECTGYIVQLPLPKHLDENAALERVDPAKDADGLHPTNLGRLVLERARRRCRARRAASCTCCAASTSRSPVRTWWSSAAVSPSAARWACC